MDGPTAHPTGVTLASGDPTNSLTVRWGELGSRPRVAAAPVFVLEAVREHWRALTDGEGAGELEGPGSWETKCPSSPQRKQRGGRRSICRRGGQ